MRLILLGHFTPRSPASSLVAAVRPTIPPLEPSPAPACEGNQESQTRCFPPPARMSSSAKETWKETYQMHLALKETEEDRPTEEDLLRTRRKETRRRITARDRP